ncbi:hypothetical protein C5167_022456 [Papaver somniferum]|uniref:Uncharacterized protein n=1 Tax=Papaver somniferum TaxID=3469 RepID=A0A4Y7JIV5_PAPSO|nr:hypothetical protein C5167_022456 [Papaver somniferum]
MHFQTIETHFYSRKVFVVDPKQHLSGLDFDPSKHVTIPTVEKRVASHNSKVGKIAEPHDYHHEIAMLHEKFDHSRSSNHSIELLRSLLLKYN